MGTGRQYVRPNKNVWFWRVLFSLILNYAVDGLKLMRREMVDIFETESYFFKDQLLFYELSFIYNVFLLA